MPAPTYRLCPQCGARYELADKVCLRRCRERTSMHWQQDDERWMPARLWLVKAGVYYPPEWFGAK